MDFKKLIFICIVIILIVAIGSIVAVNVFFQETNIEVLSEPMLYSNENFTVKLTSNNNPLTDQDIVVIFEDEKGNSTKFNLKTNNDGIATTNIENISAGNVSINIKYPGSFFYKSSNLDTNLDIIMYFTPLDFSEEYSSENSPSYSESSQNFYSYSENSDPYYDSSRDDSHQHATKEHPVTVKQSDGVYKYYGPGHFDYYGGDNHMSGGYYKYRAENKF